MPETIKALKKAYQIAKIKAEMTDEEVAGRYLTQTRVMIHLVLAGKAISKPVLHGILRFIVDTDPFLIPPQYREEAKAASMEIVGEN